MLYTLSITEDNKIINILVLPTVVHQYRLVKERSAFSHRVRGGGNTFSFVVLPPLYCTGFLLYCTDTNRYSLSPEGRG